MDSFDAVKSSGDVDMFSDDANASNNRGYIGIQTQGFGQVEEKVYDVDMLNRQLLEVHEGTIKAMKEVNNQLQQERDQLIDKKTDLIDKRNELKEKRDQLKKERKQLRYEKNELKSMKAAFLKEGQENRLKLRKIKAIIEE